MFAIREPSIAAIREASCRLRYGSNKRTVLVDATTAGAVIACYDALGETGRAKFERMIAASPTQLSRVVDFCWKHVRLAS